jgi:hypothetical protein
MRLVPASGSGTRRKNSVAEEGLEARGVALKAYRRVGVAGDKQVVGTQAGDGHQPKRPSLSHNARGRSRPDVATCAHHQRRRVATIPTRRSADWERTIVVMTRGVPVKNPSYYRLRSFSRLACICVVAWLACGNADSQVYTLTDGNASFEVHPLDTLTTQTLSVDGGPSLLNGAGYWSDLHRSVLPLSIDPDTPWGIVVRRASANSVSVIYDDPLAPIAVTYDLFGGTAGSGVASLKETITIANMLFGPLNFSLFGYRDFSLSDSDQAVTFDGMTMSQIGGGCSLIEASDRPARHYEIDNPDVLLARLNGGGPLTLSDTPTVGIPYPSTPGHAAYAFQWGVEIGPRDTLTVTTHLTVGRSAGTTVPEPASLVLLASGGIAVSGVPFCGRRRRQRVCRTCGE